jgi:hypothetical protein
MGGKCNTRERYEKCIDKIIAGKPELKRALEKSATRRMLPKTISGCLGNVSGILIGRLQVVT